MTNSLKVLRLGTALTCFCLPVMSFAGNIPPGTNSFSAASNFDDIQGFSSITNLETFTSESNEPGHRSNGSVAAGKTAWWRWTAPENGFVSIDTMAALDGQIPDPVLSTVMAVYTGSSLTNLVRVTANDDYWLIRTGYYYGLSNVAFYAQKAVTYWIAVDGNTPSSINSAAKNVFLRLRHLAARSLTRQTIWGDSNDPSLRGSLSLTQTSSNAFTASITMGTRTVAFRGSFDIEGYFRTSFDRPTRSGFPPLPPLFIEIDGVTGELRTHDSNGIRTFDEFLEVATFSVTSPNPVSGYFTASTTGPGYLTATISSSGTARGSVRTPDDSVFTFSRRLSQRAPGQFVLPLFKSLRTGTGFWSAYTVIKDGGSIDDWFTFVPSSNRFVRAPSPTSIYYTAGLNFAVQVFGGTYTKPASNQRALGFLNASNGAGTLGLSATPGELVSSISLPFTWTPQNRITFTDQVRRPSLTLTAGTGLLTGGITLTGESRRTLRGVLYRYQGTPRFAGFATGKSRMLPLSIP